MAKSSSFFGLRRGSTKTLTFSVLDGQQITKDRVSEVKNPRTDLQMQQRCLMKTCSLGYSAMKSIVDHSFEGISYGAKSMAKFTSLNYKLVKAASKAYSPVFGFPSYADSAMRMGQFVVAQGSLNRPIIGGITVTPGDNKITVALPAAATVAELANALGINLGELITLVALVQDDNKTVAFTWLRFTLPESDAALTTTAIKVESNLASETSLNANKLSVVMTPQEQRISAASAILFDFIRSAKASAGWLRSSAKLTNVVGTPSYELGWDAAIATYPTGASYILNDGQSGIQSEGSVQYGVVVKVENSLGTVPAASNYTIEGNGLYNKGDRCTVTLKKNTGQPWNDAVCSVNGQTVAQNPVGTVTFEVTGVMNVVWDIKVSDDGGEMGE